MRYINRFAVLLKRLVVILLTMLIIVVVWDIYRTLIPNVWYRRHLAVSLISLWLLSAYVVLPRVHRILSRIYLPGYFVGRTRTPDGLLGDPVNLAVNGSQEALIKAMEAAGWHQADRRTIKTMFRIVWTSILGKSYPNAPVSDLYVFGNRQDLVFQIQRGGNPRKRHHVRFWRVPRSWYLPGGYKVDWVGAATYDDAVGFSLFTWQITHSINSNVDDERDFLVSTLKDANMLRSSTRVEHYFVGYKARNGVNGSKMVTDGSLVIADLIGESHARAVSGMQHATLDSVQQEIYNLAQADDASKNKQDTTQLIDEIEKELEHVRKAHNEKKPPKDTAKEAMDVVLRSVELIGSLGQRTSEVYRDKMDKNWDEYWADKDKKHRL